MIFFDSVFVDICGILHVSSSLSFLHFKAIHIYIHPTSGSGVQALASQSAVSVKVTVMCMHIFQWGDRDYAAKAVVLQRADEAHRRNDYWDDSRMCDIIRYLPDHKHLVSRCF